MSEDTGKTPECEVLQCCLCMIWFHIDCVGISKKALKKVDFWSCPNCRHMSRHIKELKCSVNELKKIVLQLASSTTTNQSFVDAHLDDVSVCANLEEKLSEKIEECENLKTEIHNLNIKMKSLHDSITDDSDCSDCEIVETKPRSTHKKTDYASACGHLIIGDSLIKDVDPVKDKVYIACKRGAKLKDVTKKLKEDKRVYESINIVCGTNNVASKDDAEI